MNIYTRIRGGAKIVMQTNEALTIAIQVWEDALNEANLQILQQRI